MAQEGSGARTRGTTRARFVPSPPPHETHSRTRNTIVVGADVAGPWVGVDTVTVATQTLVPGGWRGHGEVGGEAHVRVCIIR